MKTICLFLSCCCTVAVAQVPTLDLNESSRSVKYNNPAAIGQKTVQNLTYSDVRGKCFWDNDWNPGILILKGGSVVKMSNVKLNLYTNDIHYLNREGVELVAQTGQVKKLILFSNQDTTKAVAVFHSLAGTGSNKGEVFYQILNDGKIQLLKRVTVNLRKKDYDPSVGKAEYRFASDTDYFLKDDSGLNLLKGLNKSAVLDIIKPTDATDQWLSSHKNKLKSEEDVVAFLAFINSEEK